MTKALKDLLALVQHAKAARHHLERCKELAGDRFQWGLHGELEAVNVQLEALLPKVQRLYGAAVMGATRRAR